MPKHDGHATVASRAPQCPQWVESVEADAPHIGQLRVSAAMMGNILPARAESASAESLQSGFDIVLHRHGFPHDDATH